MASELAATRIWKPSRGSARSSAGIASSRRKSAMAESNSAAVGRSCGISGSAFQQLQQIDLGLDRAPADRGELHRLDRAREMSPGLIVADDAPARRAQHFPPMGACRIDRAAARRLVGLPQLLAAAEAAGRLIDGAEAPAFHA